MVYDSSFALVDSWRCIPTFERFRYVGLYNRFIIGIGYARLSAFQDLFTNQFGATFGNLRFGVWLHNGGLITGTEIIDDEPVEVVYTASVSLLHLYDCINSANCAGNDPKCEELTFSDP